MRMSAPVHSAGKHTISTTCIAPMCLLAPIDSGSTLFYSFFFFQAEDGIRDVAVTGVQTCALPICFDVVHDQVRIQVANCRADGIDQRVRIANGADFKIVSPEIVKASSCQRRVHARPYGVPDTVVVYVACHANNLESLGTP